MDAVSSYPTPVPPAPELTIRRVKAFDAREIAELRARWTTGEEPDWLFISSIRTWLETEGEPRITLMASVHDQPVGMISLLEYRGMPVPGARSSRWGYLDHLFVTEDSRHQGVGTALITETIAIADHRDYQKLLVAPTAAALSLFHRLGFTMLDEHGPEGIMLLRASCAAER